MQKRKQKHKKLIKKITIYTILVALLLLLIFAEDIIKLANKNEVGLLENTPNITILAEPNAPESFAGMIPIKWNGENWVITTKTDNYWFDYKNGKPAYAMLNDGYYKSELERGIEEKQLMENNEGIAITHTEDLGTIIMWIPRFAINDETNDIKYIKGVEKADEGWTIPEMFTYKQANETMPDFLLTGIWLEKDIDSTYISKMTEMNKEESIYGFIANTKAVASDQTTQNQIQNYYNTLTANTVGAGLVSARAQEEYPINITNPNRIILKKINQNHQDPIKAKGEYNKNAGIIEIQVTYSQYGIEKILYENTAELKLEKNGRQVLATSEGIDVEDGERTITIIDNKGNTKELKIKVESRIYVTLYTDGTLAFGKSTNPIPEKTISASYGDISGKTYSMYSKADSTLYTNTPWNSNKGSIRTVEFVNKIYPISTSSWFVNCTNLTTINNIEKLNTKYVTNMQNMFYGCSGLSSLDLSGLDTSNVTNMINMFYGCSGLSSLNLSGLDTSKVTNMANIFYNCGNLTSLNLSGLDTSNVTNMTSMFYNCSSLTGLDLSSFDTSNVTSMASMFRNCSSLTSLDLSSFDTSNVTTMVYMFYNCSSLTSLDLSSFDTGNVTTMDSMFFSCNSLTSIDLRGFDTSNVTSVSGIFTNCSSLIQISFGENWNKQVTLPIHVRPCIGWYSDSEFTNKVAEARANYTPKVPITIYANVLSDVYVKLYTDGTLAFCSNNSQIPFKELSQDYGNITGKNYSSSTIPWINEQGNVTNVNIIDEISPVSTAYWFYKCSNLIAINNIEKLDTGNVTSMTYMFYNCSSLTSLNLSSFDTGNVTIMNSMFYGCSSLTSLDLSSFDTSKVTGVSAIFHTCSSLIQISFGEKWNQEVTLPTFEKPCAGWYSDETFTNKVAKVGANYTPVGPITIYANFPADIYAKLYTDGTLALSLSDNTMAGKELSQDYGNILGNTTSTSSWKNESASITTVEFVDEIYPISTAGWFSNCKNLTTINNIEKLNTNYVTNMSYMFSNCSSLTNLNLSSFDTSNVTSMQSMFSSCSSLTSLDLSSFNTRNVTNMDGMFYGCRSLTSLDLNSFNTYNVTTMKNMFYTCSSLTNLNLSSFNTYRVTDMSYMFSRCSSLTSINLNSFNTYNVTTMYQMFYYCSSLTSLDLSSFNTYKVTKMDTMFFGCSKLKTIYVGTSWRLATSTTNMFASCGTSTTTLKK